MGVDIPDQINPDPDGGGGGGWPLTADVSGGGFSIHDLGGIDGDGADSWLTFVDSPRELHLNGSHPSGLAVPTDGSDPYFYLGAAPRLYGTQETPFFGNPGLHMDGDNYAAFEVWAGDTTFAEDYAVAFLYPTLTGNPTIGVDSKQGGVDRGAALFSGNETEDPLLNFYIGSTAINLYGTAETTWNGLPGLQLPVAADQPEGGLSFELLWGDYQVDQHFGVAAVEAGDGFAEIDLIASENGNIGRSSMYFIVDADSAIIDFVPAGLGSAQFSVEADADQWRIPIRDHNNTVVGAVGGAFGDTVFMVPTADVGDALTWVMVYPDVVDISGHDQVYIDGALLRLFGAAGIDGTDTLAVAADPASTMALANAIRQILIDLGAAVAA